MQYICLSLREESSRVAFIKTKENRIHVNQVGTIDDSLLEYVRTGNIPALSDALSQLSQKGQYQRLLISYPSYLGHADCFHEPAQSGQDLSTILPSLIYTHFDVENKKEYCTDAVLTIPSQEGTWITAIYLHSRYTDVITEAARLSGFKQCEGEPEAVAAARLIHDSPYLSYLLEIGPESGAITCYHPGKGMFTIPAPAFGWNTLLREGGILRFHQQMGIAELASQKIFGEENLQSENTAIYILSEKSQEIREALEGYEGRLQTLHLPGIVRVKNDPELYGEYVVPIALGLKPVAEKLNRIEAERNPETGPETRFTKILQKIPVIRRMAADRS